MTVRRVSPTDWRLIKDVRLEMLADSPAAYVTTLAEAEAHPDSVWIDRAQVGSESTVQATYLGMVGSDVSAMGVGLRRDQDGTDVLVIVSVYVTARHRGSGIADDLMAAIESWGSSWGAPIATLWVNEKNSRAKSFYTRRGYDSTPDRIRMDPQTDQYEIRLEKRLSDQR